MQRIRLAVRLVNGNEFDWQWGWSMETRFTEGKFDQWQRGLTGNDECCLWQHCCT